MVTWLPSSFGDIFSEKDQVDFRGPSDQTRQDAWSLRPRCSKLEIFGMCVENWDPAQGRILEATLETAATL